MQDKKYLDIYRFKDSMIIYVGNKKNMFTLVKEIEIQYEILRSELQQNKFLIIFTIQNLYRIDLSRQQIELELIYSYPLNNYYDQKYINKLGYLYQIEKQQRILKTTDQKGIKQFQMEYEKDQEYYKQELVKIDGQQYIQKHIPGSQEKYLENIKNHQILFNNQIFDNCILFQFQNKIYYSGILNINENGRQQYKIITQNIEYYKQQIDIDIIIDTPLPFIINNIVELNNIIFQSNKQYFIISDKSCILQPTSPITYDKQLHEAQCQYFDLNISQENQQQIQTQLQDQHNVIVKINKIQEIGEGIQEAFFIYNQEKELKLILQHDNKLQIIPYSLSFDIGDLEFVGMLQIQDEEQGLIFPQVFFNKHKLVYFFGSEENVQQGKTLDQERYINDEIITVFIDYKTQSIITFCQNNQQPYFDIYKNIQKGDNFEYQYEYQRMKFEDQTYRLLNNVKIYYDLDYNRICICQQNEKRFQIDLFVVQDQQIQTYKRDLQDIKNYITIDSKFILLNDNLIFTSQNQQDQYLILYNITRRQINQLQNISVYKSFIKKEDEYIKVLQQNDRKYTCMKYKILNNKIINCQQRNCQQIQKQNNLVFAHFKKGNDIRVNLFTTCNNFMVFQEKYRQYLSPQYISSGSKNFIQWDKQQYQEIQVNSDQYYLLNQEAQYQRQYHINITLFLRIKDGYLEIFKVVINDLDCEKQENYFQQWCSKIFNIKQLERSYLSFSVNDAQIKLMQNHQILDMCGQNDKIYLLTYYNNQYEVQTYRIQNQVESSLQKFKIVYLTSNTMQKYFNIWQIKPKTLKFVIEDKQVYIQCQNNDEKIYLIKIQEYGDICLDEMDIK